MEQYLQSVEMPTSDVAFVNLYAAIYVIEVSSEIPVSYIIITTKNRTDGVTFGNTAEQHLFDGRSNVITIILYSPFGTRKQFLVPYFFRL